MIKEHPYEAIDPSNLVAVKQRSAYLQARQINAEGSQRTPVAVMVAQTLQEEALKAASDANLMTPSMLPREEGK